MILLCFKRKKSSALSLSISHTGKRYDSVLYVTACGNLVFSMMFRDLSDSTGILPQNSFAKKGWRLYFRYLLTYFHCNSVTVEQNLKISTQCEAFLEFLIFTCNCLSSFYFQITILINLLRSENKP